MIDLNQPIGSTTPSAISIESVAKILGVSLSTVRNWIKLGYINSVGANLIDKDSLDNFNRDVVGFHKLNSRANKQHKPSLDNITTYNTNQWQSYENSLSESYRNREGIYYTPEDVVKDLCSKIESCDFSSKIFLDPCCGSGNFLIRALEMGFLPQNIYGYDIDSKAVDIARARIEELSGYKTPNIRCVDFLDIADSLDLRVDYIFTNPPWGKKIEKSYRKRLSVKYSAGQSSDSSSLFIYASLPLLRDGGQVGFLLQEAFFNIATYADIRRRMFDMNISYLIDYKRPFRTLLTKAQAIVADSGVKRNSTIMCQCNGDTYSRSRESFICNPHLIYNITTTTKEGALIAKLLSGPHSTLKGCARWGMGIVTGDNNRFCSDTPRSGFRAVYRGSDIVAGGFKSPTLYINEDLSQYQQVAPLDLYDTPSKLIYRFISSKLCFACDSEQRLILNSANFLILNSDFPISPEELMKFLNSDFTNWLFQKIFSTRKILRGDLETLPIFLDYFDNGIFCESNYLKHLNIHKIEGGGYEMID